MQPLRDNIKVVLAKKDDLSFGDLRYILLSKKLSKIFKSKKKHYMELKKIFSTEEFFENYPCKDANLARILNRMERDGEVKKIGEKPKYRISNECKLQAIRLKDIANLKSYSLNQIYVYTPFPHQSKLDSPTRVYGINEKFLKHAEQVGMKKRIISKINDIEEKTREINQLKNGVEGMYKTKLFLDQCKKLNDSQIMKVVLKNLYDIYELIMLPLLYEKMKITKKEEVKLIFDRRKAKNEVELVLKESEIKAKLSIFDDEELSTKPEKKEVKKKHKKKELTSEQIEKIVKILEKVYKSSPDIYRSYSERDYMTSIVVSRPRWGDMWDTPYTTSFLDKLQKEN